MNTVQRIHESLGPKPFNIKRGINVAVFDSVMIAFATSKTTPTDIGERFEKLKANDSYQEAVGSGTADIDMVARRVKLAKEKLFR